MAEVLCYGGGSGGGGDGPPGSSGKGGRSAKEEIEEMNKAACRGAIHSSAGARSVGLHRQEKMCSVVCGAEPQSGQAGNGALPTLWSYSAAVTRSQLRERTALWSRKQSLRRVYFKGRTHDFVGGGGSVRRSSFTQKHKTAHRIVSNALTVGELSFRYGGARWGPSGRCMWLFTVPHSV